MRRWHVMALLVAFAWQNTPVGVARDPLTGAAYLAFGAGAYGVGRDEYFSDCNGGNFKKATSDAVGSAGAVIEVYPADHVRLAGAAGTFGGSFYTSTLLSYELPRFGLGGGFATGRHKSERHNSTGVDTLTYGWTGPSAYLRIGDREHAHFRAELLTPEPTYGLTGFVRAGVALASRIDRPSVYLGVARVQAYAPLPSDVVVPLQDETAAFADFALDLGRSVDLWVKFHAASHSFGFGTGLRLETTPPRGSRRP